VPAIISEAYNHHKQLLAISLEHSTNSKFQRSSSEYNLTTKGACLWFKQHCRVIQALCGIQFEQLSIGYLMEKHP